MPKMKCVDCGDETEHAYEVILKTFRSKNGGTRRWKGGICEECLQKRFDGMVSLRPLYSGSRWRSPHRLLPSLWQLPDVD